MILNSLFTIVIFLLVSILVFFSIKVYIDTLVVEKKGNFEYLKLKDAFTIETKRNQINQQKISLVDELNESLFSRLFKIAKDLLSLQKLIFDKPAN